VGWPKMLQSFNQESPSHGRGRRFNPYSAHHFSRLFSTQLGTNWHQPAAISTFRRGADVESIRRLFGSIALPILYAEVGDSCSRHSLPARLTIHRYQALA
jgi:hypothetical protein